MAVKAILTDIEGTTTDINFVHKVLFPYAAKHLPDYVNKQAHAPVVAAILKDVAKEIGNPDADLDTLVQALMGWIAEDKKVTPLKALQGLIWFNGYHEGDFTGHLYPDATEYLHRWHEQGIGLYVFSSGSVAAQKLLFGHSDAGDLTGLFSGYFDTTTGHKREQTSYAAIAEAIGLPAADILFLSDIVEELDAARSAGMQTTLLARDEQPDHSDHPVVSSFNQIQL